MKKNEEIQKANYNSGRANFKNGLKEIVSI